MFVRRLTLTNLRSRHELTVELGDRLNVLVGPNGAGKTTVLEAASLVLQGTPLRSGSMRDLISRDRDHLRVEVELATSLGENAPGSRRAPGSLTAAAAYSRDGERRLTCDGAVLEDATRWREVLPVRALGGDANTWTALPAGRIRNIRQPCADTKKRCHSATPC
jgi:recombinational DNA repair ATPase RecF